MQVFPHGEYTNTVDTSSRYNALCSAGWVRAAHHRTTGEWCTEAQAIAACFSVPDGVSVDFAALNVGVEMRELDARDWVAQRNGFHAALKAVRP